MPQVSSTPSCSPLRTAGIVVSAAFILSCGDTHDSQSLVTPGVDAGVAPPLNPLGRARCQAPAGMAAASMTTDQAVELLNALPKPTSVACFLESLPRPLLINATNSPFSAQPASSTVSPRVFVKLGQLWTSVVIDGESSYLLEFGYRPTEDAMTSIKGELELPLHEAVPPSAPYDRVRSDAGTTCGLCHFNENRAADIGFADAYDSIAFRPRPDSHVDVALLKAESAACRWELNAHRCEMLSAIFDGGPVLEAPFPDAMATFF